MSTDNNNVPNSNVPNTDASASGTTTSTDSATAQTNPTNSETVPRRRGADPRFIWGTVAVLVACVGLFCYCTNSSTDKVAGNQPADSTRDDPTYDPNLPSMVPEESVVESTSETATSNVENTVQDPSSELSSTAKSETPSTPIDEYEPSRFNEQPIPSNITKNDHFVFNDSTSVGNVYFANKPYSILAGSKLFLELCHGSLAIDSDKDPSMSRQKYYIRVRNRELQFYHMPMCVITKEKWSELLTAIEQNLSIAPDKEMTFTLPFETSCEEVRIAMANELNEVFGLTKDEEKKFKPNNILPPPYIGYTLTIGEGANQKEFKGGPSDNAGIPITGTPRELNSIVRPVAGYVDGNIPFKVEYQVSGIFYERTHWQNSLQNILSVKNIGDYFKNEKFQLRQTNANHSGGGLLNFNIGYLSLDVGEADQATYGKSDFSEWIEENDLIAYTQIEMRRCSQFFDTNRKEEVANFIQQDLDKVLSSIPSIVIPLSSDGTPNFSNDPEKEKVFTDWWNKIKEGINKDKLTTEEFEKLLPKKGSNLPNPTAKSDQNGPETGLWNIKGQRFFGLDHVRNTFKNGVKFYKISKTSISQSLDEINTSIHRSYGTYPIVATPILFKGKYPARYKQGYCKIHVIDSKNSIGAKDIIYEEEIQTAPTNTVKTPAPPTDATASTATTATTDATAVPAIAQTNNTDVSLLPADGQFYFVTSSSNNGVLNEDRTHDDYCLGTGSNAETQFTLSALPGEYNSDTREISLYVICEIKRMVGNIRGSYKCKHKLTGKIPESTILPDPNAYKDGVKVGYVLKPSKELKYKSDTNDFAVAIEETYLVSYESNSILKQNYNNMALGETRKDNKKKDYEARERHLEPSGFKNDDERNKLWYSNPGVYQRAFSNNITNPIDNKKLFSKDLIVEGEHHYYFPWIKVEDRKYIVAGPKETKIQRNKEMCQTYYNVRFEIPTGTVVTIPYVYQVIPERDDFYILGSVGAGAHLHFNNATQKLEPMEEDQFNERKEQFQKEHPERK